VETPPNGCLYCGTDKRIHATRWAMGPGLHGWIEPTNEVRKQRLLARRNKQENR
jgi:hypothetical protein